MLPLLLRMFVQKDGCKTNFLEGYAATEVSKISHYFNDMLAGKTYLVADKLTGADIMMSFVVELLANSGDLVKFEHIQRYATQLSQHSAWNKANQIEQSLDISL